MDHQQTKKARAREVHRAWKRYPAIAPHHRRAVLDPKDEKARWVVLEKVHGANFCFVTNGTDVVTAKRSTVLPPHERFFGWQDVLTKYQANLIDLYHKLRACQGFTDITEACVFGELFGGRYPHPDVAAKGLSRVQEGVYYSPDIDFFAFDIQVVRASGRRTWLDYDRATELFKACGLFHAEALMEGTLAKCLAFNIECNSTIPARLGLPPLAKNQMEGVIIKAAVPVFLLQLDQENQPVRAIFKKKNAQFDEVNPRSRHLDSNRKRGGKAPDQTAREMERYINVNRLRSLESKMGPVTRDNLPEAALALAEDALQDFIADNPALWAKVDAKGKTIRTKHYKALVLNWLTAHLEGEANGNDEGEDEDGDDEDGDREDDQHETVA